VWILSNRISPSRNAEEEVSIRAVVRNYLSSPGSDPDAEITPTGIYEIASGFRKGNRAAAIQAFHTLGRHLGDVIANLVSLMDGLVVLGGGIAGAERYFMPAIMEELENKFDYRHHDPIPRVIQKVFNLNEASGRRGLTENTGTYIHVPGSAEKIYYDQIPKVGIGTSRIGTSRAISLGAYAFALKKLDGKIRK
jgi:glucokinase